MNNDSKRFYRKQLEQEYEKRNAERKRVVDIVLANFVRHPRGKVGMNVVYELVAQTLGRANGPGFKRWVAEILLAELGVYRVGANKWSDGRRISTGRIDRNGFKGICTQEYLDWRLAEDARAKAANAEHLRRMSPESRRLAAAKCNEAKRKRRAEREAAEAAAKASESSDNKK